ncbi:MAG: M20/M25/M40 family metallo-hydrolase [Calditrichaeota bacterium]|nr:M20/M25/M40 family metallo-hydrolase [Calditrichota bacterium]
MKQILFSFVVFLLLNQLSFAQGNLVRHNLDVRVNPAEHTIQVTDTITFPDNAQPEKWEFLLNKELKVQSADPDMQVVLVETDVKAKDAGMDMEEPEVAARVRQNRYKLIFKKNPQKSARIILRYSGEIYNEVKQLSEEYARGFSTSPGIISEEGVYLAGSSDWIPWFGKNLFTFTLTTRLPKDWDVVSQGRRIRRELIGEQRVTAWLSAEPMEEVFLIAGKFYEYNRKVGPVQVMAFLRSPDEALAAKYLETTGQYLEMYRKLIGSYPFWKFALVENFWETGYGMPSFTLLGPQIIRFPFILHSSYPHELLHNWWGNSVYVDFNHGNWCEGLTVYMADHLIKEQRGQGTEYRRSTLQKYTDYVNPQNDFPLNKFISRHDAASEAIGYGKCMMMWDMLRLDMGDNKFIAAVQKFYSDNKFRRASFDDLRQAFEAVSGNDYKSFFKQWLERTGAPELQLSNVEVKSTGNDFILNITLKQIQNEAPFDLKVPVAVSFKDEIKFEKVRLTSSEQNFTFTYKKRPLMVRIDPQFHVFRRLHYNEIPPSLSKIFGAEKILIILPDNLQPDNRYSQLAEIWSKSKSKDVLVKKSAEIKTLPKDRAIWIFGRDNPFVQKVKSALKNYDAEIGKDQIRFKKSAYPVKGNSFVISVRHPENPRSVLVWLTIGKAQAVKGLARKLPHYGKYSYLAFNGSEPTNIVKGQWHAVNSPLLKIIPLKDGKLPQNLKTELPKRPPLADLPQLFSGQRMLKDIKFLSSDELQGRAPGSAGIEKAAQYIAQQFKKAGLQPGADDGSYFQVWEEVVDAKGTKAPVKNIIGIIPGTNPHLADQAVVVSAHYDHLGLGWPDAHKGDEGKIHPGADDNASGVSVLLELARILDASFNPQRTIVFVAFTAEESGLKGSRYFVKHYKKFPPDKIMADLNLDTVGRLNGKKVLILNGSSAKEWPFLFMGIGYVTGVQSEIVTQQLDASDQASFIEAGVPAVQIFSGAHSDYHRPTDTWDKIDVQGLTKVATLTKEALVYLASERQESLSKQIAGQSKLPAAHGRRRVTTGTMPDFTYSGKGVKIQSVTPDSPAEKAGLKAEDIIKEVGGMKTDNIKEYSDVLKTFNPGDEVTVKFERNGKIQETRLKLQER